MKYSMLIATMLCMWVTTSHAEMGFDQRYERDYNIFKPANGAIPETAAGFLRWRRSRYSSTKPAVHTKCGMDAPLNPANAYHPDSAFNPANRYNPENPLSPANKYNPTVPFGPLDGFTRPERWRDQGIGNRDEQ